MKGHSSSVIVRELQGKTTKELLLTPLGWLLSERQETAHAGKNIEEREYTNTFVRLYIGVSFIIILQRFLKKTKRSSSFFVFVFYFIERSSYLAIQLQVFI